MIRLPQAGTALALRSVTNHDAGRDLVLRLYLEAGAAERSEDFVEADFPGYAPALLEGPAWAIAEDPPEAEYPTQTFTATAGTDQEVAGYYLTQAQTGRLLGSETFLDGPYRILRRGDYIQVTPVLRGP